MTVVGGGFAAPPLLPPPFCAERIKGEVPKPLGEAVGVVKIGEPPQAIPCGIACSPFVPYG